MQLLNLILNAKTRSLLSAGPRLQVPLLVPLVVVVDDGDAQRRRRSKKTWMLFRVPPGRRTWSCLPNQLLKFLLFQFLQVLGVLDP